MPGQWKNHQQTQALPADWQNLVRKTRQRAHGKCQAIKPYRLILEEHPGHAADHIKPRSQGGDNSLSNLQWICSRCHARKTSLEALEARKNLKLLVKRSPESHPGKVVPIAKNL